MNHTAIKDGIEVTTAGSEAPTGTVLGRLAGPATTAAALVLVLWIVAIIGITVLSQVVGTHFKNKFTAGNTPSQQAQNILAARFPSQVGRHRRHRVPHGDADHRQPGSDRRRSWPGCGRCPTCAA